MARLVIVLNHVHAAIEAKVKEAFASFSEARESDKQELYDRLLQHFDETGQIADCTVTKNAVENIHEQAFDQAHKGPCQDEGD